MIQIQVTRNLIGLEDLLVGVGTVEQIRGAGSETTDITRINAQNFPYDATRTLGERLTELEILAESLSVVDEDGNFLTGYLNTSDDALNLAGRLWRRTPVADPDVAEIWYGSVRVLKYNETTGDVIIPDNVNYIAADTALSAALTTYIDAADATLSAAITALDDSLGTAALLDVGTGPNNIVQLSADEKLPAVDGSQLTNLPDTMPVGAIILSAHNVADTNFSECDGAAISRTTYATLYAKIGTTFGAGDGSTTFNKPDLRGEFVRGWDHGRGIDSGRAYATSQADAFKAHQHVNTFGSTSASGSSGGTVAKSGSQYLNTSSSVGSSETRPRNIALMYQIKVL